MNTFVTDLKQTIWKVALIFLGFIGGCSTSNGPEKTSWNLITGGYRVTEIAKGVYLVVAKSGPYIPSESAAPLEGKLVLSLFGQGIGSARKRWGELAVELCGGENYKEHRPEEYSYRYSPGYPQQIAAKAAYLICPGSQLSEDEIGKLGT